MLYKCYLRNGIVYVPAVGKRGGVYTVLEPIAVVPVTNTEGLHHAFSNAIGKGNQAVPTVPKGSKWPPPVLPKYAGVKSWSAFARSASTWSIVETAGKYLIDGYRMHDDGYWVEDPNQRIEFPRGASVDDVVDRMIAILQDAARK